MRVLLTGSTGFIGSHLAPALVAAGHDVVAMTRHPDRYDGAGMAVYGDTQDRQSLTDAVTGCDAAYYLVHGMDEPGDFEHKDVQQASTFGEVCAAGELSQIVYLGGLGASGDDLSEHLRSRQEVEDHLGAAGVPVTALRAALVIGAGSASFELLRQTVAALPVLVVPPEASTTEVQPIALADVVRYLVGVLGLREAIGAVLEVGGPDRLTYDEMLRRMADHLGVAGPTVRLPILPTSVAELGIKALTDVDPTLARALLDSLGNDVVVNDNRITTLLPGPLAGFEEMLTTALAAEAPTSTS